MVDWSLATQIQPPQIQTPAQMATGAMQIQQFRNQNALRGILSQPDAIGPDGQPSQNTLKQIMAVDPRIGAALQQDALKTQGMKAELYQKKHEMMVDAATPVQEFYEDQVSKGIAPEIARTNAQKQYTEALNGLETGGHLTPDEIKRLPTNYDPVRVGGFIQTYQQHKQSQLAERARTDTEKHMATEERQRDEQLDIARQAAGARDYTPPQEIQVGGKPVLAQQDKRTGGWVTADDKRTPIAAADLRKSADVRADAKVPGVISDEAANLAADRLLAGDERATTGMARSAPNITKVTNAIAERAAAQGMSGADIAKKVAEFAGMMAGERTLGTRAANMEIAANEVKNMAPLALSSSEKVDRTKYPSLNAIIQSAEKGTGDEEIVRFGLAANSLIYTYSKFLNPTGIPTDADKARATEILSTAWSKGQFRAAVDQIKKEIASGQGAVQTTRTEMGETLTGEKKASSQAPAQKQTEPAKSTIPVLKSKSEYDALPSGAKYRKEGDPADKWRVKP